MNSTILVVDAQQGQGAEIIQDSLTDKSVVGVASFARAKEVVLERDVDVVVLFSSLLTGDDIEGLRELRKIRPAVSGILVSSSTDPGLLVAAVNCGFSRICQMPLKVNELTGFIAEILQRRNVWSENARLKTLLPLYDLGRKFIAAESEGDIYQELAESIGAELKVPIVSVMLFDAKRNSLRVVAYRGLAPKYVENLVVRPGEQIAGKVFQTKRPVILNRQTQHKSPYSELLERKELAAAICYPFVSREASVMGVLNIGESDANKEFGDGDVEMLKIISDQALMAVENLRHIETKQAQARLQTVFEQYLSPELSKVLVDNAGTEHLLEVGGVQDLTVLFADIRNFTLLVQELPLDTLRGFLNNFFSIFSQAVFTGHGMLDKFMGDAVLAVFGAPLKLENPSMAAVTAACKVMRDFEAIRLSWIEDQPVFAHIGLGIGVSRGQMYLGNVGSADRLDYTVLGLEVNIAQRLASETEAGKILITDPVYTDLHGSFVISSARRKKLRGVHQPLKIYTISECSEH